MQKLVRALRLPILWGLFLGLDACFFKALPLLYISYGAILFPLLVTSIARLGITLVCLLGQALSQWMTRSSGARGLSFWGGAWIFLNLLVYLGMVYVFCIEPFWITVTKLELSGPRMSLNRPLRIVQLTDIHVERITRRETEMLRIVADAKPDLILLTGDYVNLDYLHDATALRDTQTVFSQLHAPLGVFAINESVYGFDALPVVAKDTDIRILNNESYRLALPGGEMYLIGLSNLDWGSEERKLQALTNDLPRGAYVILMHHAPDLATAAAINRVNLYVTGHTHGGQVRIPWYGALTTFSRYGKQFEMGRYDFGSTVMYVNRGLGMEGFGWPRVRFLCPPEILIVDLYSR